MKTSKFITLLFLLVFGFAVSTSFAQTGTAKVVNVQGGPVYSWFLTNLDSLTYPYTSQELDISLIDANTGYLTAFSSLIAGDTLRATAFGRFDYDSAGVQRTKWDSLGTQLIVGTTDSNTVIQSAFTFTFKAPIIRWVIRRPSAATVPILSSLNNRVVYLRLHALEMDRIPEVKSFNIQAPNR